MHTAEPHINACHACYDIIMTHTLQVMYRNHLHAWNHLHVCPAMLLCCSLCFDLGTDSMEHNLRELQQQQVEEFESEYIRLIFMACVGHLCYEDDDDDDYYLHDYSPLTVLFDWT